MSAGQDNSQGVTKSITQVLSGRAAKTPERIALTFLGEEGSRLELDYDCLATCMHSWAALVSLHAKRGSTSILIYRDVRDFVPSFLGCLEAGVIAVPCAVPNARRSEGLIRLIRKASSQVILTSESLLPMLTDLTKTLGTHVVSTPDLEAYRDSPKPSSFETAPASPSDIAYLQFTSGSTSSPSGVAITHKNLTSNLDYIRQSFELGSGFGQPSVSVSWLPHFHDMGLVDGILEPIFAGFSGVLMSPRAFIKNPISWLKAISDFRGTHGGGPNFAYDLCTANRSNLHESLDLSSWRSAYNGSETVRKETLDRFYESFKEFGFRMESFYPCYGLAESTLMVTGDKVDRSPTHVRVGRRQLEEARAVEVSSHATSTGEEETLLVSSGVARLDTDVRIVDASIVLPDRSIGEIWVSSPSIGSGYYRDAKKTKHAFRNQVSGSDKHFLRTGDLGFLDGGQLYVTGRSKEIIIVRGRNLYPYDIEQIVEESHEAVSQNAVAAYSFYQGSEERLGIASEVERSWRRKPLDGVIEAIRTHIADTFQVPCTSVVLLRPQALPRTTSGKLQRSRVASLLSQGDLDVLAESKLDDSTHSDDSRSSLLEVIRSFTQNPSFEICDETTFFQLGLDSLRRAELARHIEVKFKVSLPLEQFFKMNSVTDLRQFLATSGPADNPRGEDAP